MRALGGDVEKGKREIRFNIYEKKKKKKKKKKIRRRNELEDRRGFFMTSFSSFPFATAVVR